MEIYPKMSLYKTPVRSISVPYAPNVIKAKWNDIWENVHTTNVWPDERNKEGDNETWWNRENGPYVFWCEVIRRAWSIVGGQDRTAFVSRERRTKSYDQWLCGDQIKYGHGNGGGRFIRDLIVFQECRRDTVFTRGDSTRERQRA